MCMQIFLCSKEKKVHANVEASCFRFYITYMSWHIFIFLESVVLKCNSSFGLKVQGAVKRGEKNKVLTGKC